MRKVLCFLFMFCSVIFAAADSVTNSGVLDGLEASLSSAAQERLLAMTPAEKAQVRDIMRITFEKAIAAAPTFEEKDAFEAFLKGNLKNPELRNNYRNAPDADASLPLYSQHKGDVPLVNYRGKAISPADAHRLEFAFSNIKKRNKRLKSEVLNSEGYAAAFPPSSE